MEPSITPSGLRIPQSLESAVSGLLSLSLPPDVDRSDAEGEPRPKRHRGVDKTQAGSYRIFCEDNDSESINNVTTVQEQQDSVMMWIENQLYKEYSNYEAIDNHLLVEIDDILNLLFDRGEENTKTFIDLLKKSTETTLRLKICVVGPSKTGKTSLIKSLTAESPSLVHPDDRTIGIDHILLQFKVQREDETFLYVVTFWDFAGQDQYQVAHSLFYSRKTLYLVCVDMEAFLVAYGQAELMGHSKSQWERLMNEFLECQVLRWVRMIFMRQPDAEFVFIGTKDDVLTEFPQFTNEVKAFLATKLEQVQGIAYEMKKELSKYHTEASRQRTRQDVRDDDQHSIAERRADMLTLYAYQKRLEKRAVCQMHESPRYVVMGAAASTTTNKDSMSLTAVIVDDDCDTNGDEETAATDTQTKTHPMEIDDDDPRKKKTELQLMFASCTDLNSVAQARESIMTLVVQSKRSFPMPESYTKVLDAVVEMRKAAACGGGDARVTRLLNPIDSLVESLLRTVSGIDDKTCRIILQLLHDLGDVLWYEDLGINLFQKTVILDPLLMIDFVRQVINHYHKAEMLAHDELKAYPYWINLQNKERFLAMKQLLQEFQLVHPSEGAMEWDSDLIVPALWNSKTPASWLFAYEDVRLKDAVPNSDPNKPKELVRVHWQYHFTFEFPDTLFDHLVVATYSPMMKRDAGPDWILYAEDGYFACRVMVSRDAHTIERILHLEAVLGENATPRHANKLWCAFDCLSVGIIQVLRRYNGLEVTSVVLDDELQIRNLKSLLNCKLNEWTSTWMPRETSWDRYKEALEDQAEGTSIDKVQNSFTTKRRYF